MFGLAACDEGGPGFVNASVRTITNARRVVAVRLRSKCTSTHRHAQVNDEQRNREGEQTGARAMKEQLREDKEGLETHETEEENRRCKEDTRNSS